MEIGRKDEIEDLSLSPPTMGSMQIAGSNGFGHNIEFMSQAYLRNRNSEINIEDDSAYANIDRPLQIFLKFEDVEYKVRNSQASSKNPVKAVVSKVTSQLNMEQDKYKHILKGITGSIGPGEILALMGPSGSGKTTLLKIIGGRVHENVKGTITYNNIPYNPALKRRIGFVTQDDVLFPQLTVEETLVFAAFLRLPSNMSRKQKYARVEMIVKELGLERLLQILQGVAKAGRTIITTIHQPSSRMFHMFDKLLLISEGYPVYYGKARESMEYFSSLRFTPEIAMNPAEFLLDLATGQVNDISVPENLWIPQGTSESERAVVKFMILSKRTYRERCRDYFDKLRLVQALGVAILLGLLWWKSKTGTEAQLRDQGAGELFGAAVLSIKRAGMIASLVLMLFLLTGGYYVQHIPQFMQWLKYVSFMYYGFRLLLKVQYSGEQLYECESKGGCRTLQSSPSFDTVNLNGGLKEVWVLLAMALGYRLCAYICLRRRINICHL
ncbi:hypothetical protein L1049_001556 [Liquidambar formosana]|uniref:ABC transporter domain-containing protein n=1 Tax=Liquidambar formosana TaxID=63359 RepID=A0AAP0NBA0_LIQFO